MSHEEQSFNRIVSESLADIDAIGDGVDLVQRPVPPEFTNFPLGHIAFMGDFENPRSDERT